MSPSFAHSGEQAKEHGCRAWRAPSYRVLAPPPILVIRTRAIGSRAKENGETGFPISPLRTHLRRAFVALAAGRGWPQPPKGPRVANGLRDPRSPPPSSGHVRSMRMDLSHRTPYRFPVGNPLSRRGAVPRQRRLREALQRPISSFRHREEPCGPSLRPVLVAFADTKLREKNYPIRSSRHQARESRDSGGLAG